MKPLRIDWRTTKKPPTTGGFALLLKQEPHALRLRLLFLGGSLASLGRR